MIIGNLRVNHPWTVLLTPLLASFMVPPSDPFVAVLERECIILVLGGLGWA